MYNYLFIFPTQSATKHLTFYHTVIPESKYIGLLHDNREYENSMLHLPRGCQAYIGSVQITATEYNSTAREEDVIPIIPFNCCDDIPEEINELKLQPIPMRNVKLDELKDIEHHIKLKKNWTMPNKRHSRTKLRILHNYDSNFTSDVRSARKNELPSDGTQRRGRTHLHENHHGRATPQTQADHSVSCCQLFRTRRSPV